MTACCRFCDINTVTVSLVFVDSEETNHVELWQLGDEHKQQRGKVDCKVVKLILCVKTCQKKPGQEKMYVNYMHKRNKKQEINYKYIICNAITKSLYYKLSVNEFYPSSKPGSPQASYTKKG